MSGRAELDRRRAARRRLGGWLKSLKGEPRPAANIGRNHPDYGMTVHEHALAKRIRAQRAAAA